MATDGGERRTSRRTKLLLLSIVIPLVVGCCVAVVAAWYIGINAARSNDQHIIDVVTTPNSSLHCLSSQTRISEYQPNCPFCETRENFSLVAIASQSDCGNTGCTDSPIMWSLFGMSTVLPDSVYAEIDSTNSSLLNDSVLQCAQSALDLRFSSLSFCRCRFGPYESYQSSGELTISNLATGLKLRASPMAGNCDTVCGAYYRPGRVGNVNLGKLVPQREGRFGVETLLFDNSVQRKVFIQEQTQVWGLSTSKPSLEVPLADCGIPECRSRFGGHILEVNYIRDRLQTLTRGFCPLQRFRANGKDCDTSRFCDQVRCTYSCRGLCGQCGIQDEYTSAASWFQSTNPERTSTHSNLVSETVSFGFSSSAGEFISTGRTCQLSRGFNHVGKELFLTQILQFTTYIIGLPAYAGLRTSFGTWEDWFQVSPIAVSSSVPTSVGGYNYAPIYPIRSLLPGNCTPNTSSFEAEQTYGIECLTSRQTSRARSGVHASIPVVPDEGGHHEEQSTQEIVNNTFTFQSDSGIRDNTKGISESGVSDAIPHAVVRNFCGRKGKLAHGLFNVVNSVYCEEFCSGVVQGARINTTHIPRFDYDVLGFAIQLGDLSSGVERRDDCRFEVDSPNNELRCSGILYVSGFLDEYADMQDRTTIQGQKEGQTACDKRLTDRSLTETFATLRSRGQSGGNEAGLSDYLTQTYCLGAAFMGYFERYSGLLRTRVCLETDREEYEISRSRREQIIRSKFGHPYSSKVLFCKGKTSTGSCTKLSSIHDDNDRSEDHSFSTRDRFPGRTRHSRSLSSNQVSSRVRRSDEPNGNTTLGGTTTDSLSSLSATLLTTTGGLGVASLALVGIAVRLWRVYGKKILALRTENSDLQSERGATTILTRRNARYYKSGPPRRRGPVPNNRRQGGGLATVLGLKPEDCPPLSQDVQVERFGNFDMYDGGKPYSPGVPHIPGSLIKGEPSKISTKTRRALGYTSNGPPKLQEFRRAALPTDLLLSRGSHSQFGAGADETDGLDRGTGRRCYDGTDGREDTDGPTPRGTSNRRTLTDLQNEWGQTVSVYGEEDQSYTPNNEGDDDGSVLAGQLDNIRKREQTGSLEIGPISFDGHHDEAAKGESDPIPRDARTDHSSVRGKGGNRQVWGTTVNATPKKNRTVPITTFHGHNAKVPPVYLTTDDLDFRTTLGEGVEAFGSRERFILSLYNLCSTVPIMTMHTDGGFHFSTALCQYNRNFMVIPGVLVTNYLFDSLVVVGTKETKFDAENDLFVYKVESTQATIPHSYPLFRKGVPERGGVVLYSAFDSANAADDVKRVRMIHDPKHGPIYVLTPASVPGYEHVTIARAGVTSVEAALRRAGDRVNPTLKTGFIPASSVYLPPAQDTLELSRMYSDPIGEEYFRSDGTEPPYVLY